MANDVRRNLILDGDASGAVAAQEAARKAEIALNEAIEANAKTVKASTKAQDAYIKSQAQLAKTAKQVERAQSNAFRNSTRDVNQARSAVERYEDQWRDVNKQVSAFGDLDTALVGLTPLLGGAGSGAGQALTGIADVAAATEGLGRLGTVIPNLADRAREAVPLLGAFATNAGSLAAIIPGVNAGFAVTVATIAPIAAIGAAVAGGLALASAAMAEMQKSLEQLTAAENAASNARLSIAQRIAGGETTEAFKETVRELESGRDALKAELERLVQARDEAFAASAEANGDLAARLRGSGEQFTEQINQIEQQVIDAEFELSAYYDALFDGSLRANDAAAKERELNEARDEAQASLDKLTTQYNDAIAAFEENTERIAAARQLQDDRSAEDRALQEKRAEEDLQRELERQEQQHKDNLLAIAQRGNDAILAAREALAQKEADAAEKINDLRAKFADDELKRTEDFNRNRQRAEQDFRRRLAQIQDDFEQSRFDAILGNDVRALIQARRQRDSGVARETEDFGIEGDRAREDFERERERRQEALQERIADINAELEKYRAATEEKIAEIQRQTTEELAAAQAAFDEQLRLDADRRALEEQRNQEDFDIAQARKDEDRALEDERRQEALDKQLAAIQESKDVELAKIAEVDSEVTALREKEARLVAVLDQKVTAVIARANALFAGGGGNSPRSGPSPRRDLAQPRATPSAAAAPRPASGVTSPASVSSSGDSGSVNVTLTPRVMEMNGMQFVPYEDYMADKQKLLEALRTRTPR